MALQRQVHVVSSEYLGANVMGEQTAKLNGLLSRLRKLGISSIVLGLATCSCTALILIIFTDNLIIIGDFTLVLFFALSNGICTIRAVRMQPSAMMEFMHKAMEWGSASLVIHTLSFILNIALVIITYSSATDLSQKLDFAIYSTRLVLCLLLLITDVALLFLVSKVKALFFRKHAVNVVPHNSALMINQPMATQTVREARLSPNTASQQPEMRALSATAGRNDNPPSYETVMSGIAANSTVKAYC